MTDHDAELDSLFGEMARTGVPSEPAADAARRRQRAIGGMRAVQRSVLEERAAVRKRRPRITLWMSAAAAALVLAGTALAAQQKWWPASSRGHAVSALLPRSSVARAVSAVRPVAHDAAEGVPPPAAAVAPKPAASAVHQPKPTVHAASSGADLEEVNRLLVEAKRARREHRDADALPLLQEILAKHPNSVLVHEATVERFRSLSRLGRSDEAQRAARSYLVHFPTGFAADEARRLIGTSTP
jgi:hypothetical protein